VGPLGQRGGKRGGVTLRGFAWLGLGPDWGMGRIVPFGLFPIFFISFPFSFLISVLFPIFCKNASNQFKSNPKFL
jgi:hypothetical protein